jgi:hypothetical protein
MPPRRRVAPTRPAAAEPAPAPNPQTPTPTPTLSPLLLTLRPRLLERSFWTRWRRTLMSSDVIFSCAQLALMRTAPAVYARQDCPSLLLTSVLVPATLIVAQAVLGPSAYWRLRPYLLLATSPLIARGNSCYARAFAGSNGPAIAASAARLFDRAAEESRQQDASALAWVWAAAKALNSLVPAMGAVMYALLLPVSFRMRLLLQTAEVSALAYNLTSLASPVLAPFFQEDGASPPATAAAIRLARRLLGNGPCPAVVLVLLFDVWVGYLLPLGLVYLVEAAAKENHLRDLALGKPEAAAAARAAAADKQDEGEGAWTVVGDRDDGADDDGNDTGGERSSGGDQDDVAAARLLRFLSREGAPGGPALRLLRAAYVLCVVAASAYLVFRVVDAAVNVVLPRAAPATLARACPAFAAAAAS